MSGAASEPAKARAGLCFMSWFHVSAIHVSSWETYSTFGSSRTAWTELPSAIIVSFVSTICQDHSKRLHANLIRELNFRQGRYPV
jgi:hypothetical protein